MSAARAIDFLIVGQGLAGSLLAWQLLQRQQRVLVIEDHHRTSCSIAAAGLINPVTGQRLVKGPEVDACLNAATACYRALERHFAQPLLHEVAMQRLVTEPKLRDSYDRRVADPAYRDCLGEFSAAGRSGWPLHDPLGSFRQRQTGYLAVATLLALLQEELKRRDSYRAAAFSHDGLTIADDGVRWGELQARRVIFCEGYLLQRNPWFEWLPLQPAKGEILTIAADGALPTVIVNGGHWLLPLADGRHKLGASYDRLHLDEQPTVEARRELLDGLEELLQAVPPCRVVEQRAGVRPATRDKQPFLGSHPEQPSLLVFNGFGSRGSLLIPWHAQLLTAHLLDGAPLPPPLDIRRHWSAV